MAFNILFRGLICHRFDGNGETAICVAAPGHVLRLVVKKDDIFQGPQPNMFPQDTIHNDGDDRKISFAVGRQLSIVGIEATSQYKSEDFLTSVPRLVQGKGCQVLPAVLNRSLIPATAAYFTHPSGSYRVDDFFGFKAIFNGNNVEQNLARTVRLTLKSVGPVTIRDEMNKYVTVAENATVAFINELNPPEVGLVNAHFDHYEDLLQGCAKPFPMPQNTAIAADRPHPRPEAVGGTACGNTQSPPP